MPLSTVIDIIDSCNFVEEVQPQFWGEPTMHPDLGAICRYVKDSGKRCVIYTNGTGKIPKDLDRCLVSVDAHTAELQKSIRPGCDFDTVVANVREAVDAGIAVDVRSTVCIENQDCIEEVKSFWEGIVGKVYCLPEIPRTRKVEDFSAPNQSYQCPRLTEQVVVLSDGRIVICCCDWKAQHVVGHIEENSGDILKTWNAGMAVYREMLGEGNFPDLCSSCGFRTRASEASPRTSSEEL